MATNKRSRKRHLTAIADRRSRGEYSVTAGNPAPVFFLLDGFVSTVGARRLFGSRRSPLFPLTIVVLPVLLGVVTVLSGFSLADRIAAAVGMYCYVSGIFTGILGAYALKAYRDAPFRVNGLTPTSYMLSAAFVIACPDFFR